MEPLLVFESYNFESLDRSWIKRVLDSSFTDVEGVPVDYLMFLESQDMANLLKETCEVVKDWRKQNGGQEDAGERSENSENDSTEFSWQTLLSLNVDVKALHAVLAYLMKRGQAFDAGQESRRSGLRATSLYFILLSVPGSNAFQAFHPALYEIALKTLTLSQRLRDGVVPTKPRRVDYDSLEDDLGDDSEPFLTKSQYVTLTKGLNGVVYDLVELLKSASTSLEPRSLERTIFHLVDLTQLAEETVRDFSLARKSEASTSSLSYNAYVSLRLLCSEKYGSIEKISRLIGKYVLPQFVVSGGGSAQLPAKQMAIVRESTIHFIKTLLLNNANETQLALTTLIQHLMIKPLERLEGRQKQAIIVIKLINVCEKFGEIYKNSLKDLVQLSHHNKISCRIFAQEIIGKFLLDLSSSRTNREAQANVWCPNKSKRLLLAAALNGCEDSSSMVRGRAIATFADYTESVESPETRRLFEADANLPEMPSLEDLVEAIETNDVEKVLPNSRGILDMLRRRGEDERALVRRSSLQALRNGILVAPELLEEGVAIIREHCRDSALTVRRFAIRVLTSLLEKFPANESLCKDWVDSVVPRVFDAETKVQEEVLESLEKLTVQKISRHRNAQEISNLPWSILRELAANKMADHLTKACSIWVTSGTITDATVANIKSHIGTENNVESWMLLASIAEFRGLENMTIYQSYYEKALRDDEDNEGFLASLVVQVLRHCWPSFDDQSLTIIRGDILKFLEQYRVRVALISHCLDILHGIDSFRQLEESSEAGATMLNLMRLSEATIARLVDSREDEALEDPGTILFRATCILGHSSFLCAEKMSLDSLRILQGFLLEWNLLPAKIRRRKELQGAAVTVLGQQSLRDREIAQEMTPIFGRLLRNTSHDSVDENMAAGSAVRINTAKALADICMRFTALVEPYLPDMCVSMKDANPDVRQVILVIFIQLLAEDFIKINGPFFFNILSMLSDDDPTIRQMTVFLVKERLLSKNKALVTQQFINCLFHFNDYERRKVGKSQRRSSAKEREALTFAGQKGAEERRLIYDFMLEHLDSPGKLTILVNLTRQILKSRTTASRTGLGELNVAKQKGISVFKDALYVLSSEQLQPHSCARQTNDDENPEEPPPNTTNSAANSVIVEAMKKHRLEILLPGLVELKQRFAATKSPIVLDIAIFVAKLLGDYNKDQLERIHNEWPNLEKDIEMDIRECDSEERPGKPRKSSTPKKSRVDTSLLINPKWMPRIVLRRISTLTYPDNSELSAARASDSSPETVSLQPQSPSTSSGRASPRKTRPQKGPENRS